MPCACKGDIYAALAEFLGDPVVQYGPTDHDAAIVTLSDPRKGCR